jgi:hypothetical protein
MEMSEVELWASIVAGEHLIVVEDDCVHLMGVVELSPLVFVDDQRQEGATLVFCPCLAGRSKLRPASILWYGLRVVALYSKLPEAADRLIWH